MSASEFIEHGIPDGSRVRQPKNYLAIISRFDETIHSYLTHPMKVNEICGMLGVPERTLLRAFRTIRNTTPSRYVHVLRLQRVRRALSSASEGASVTRIAASFGFRELGRFAKDYKNAFGESPSDTLRSAPVAVEA
jgi:AraC family transcriptional regulator, ethanolamine operon transcriptional activator